VQSVELQGEPLGEHCGRYSHDSCTNLDTVYGAASTYYLFLSILEIAATALIVWFAWNWREPAVQVKDKTNINERDKMSLSKA